jgi:hypothetical protein
LLNFIPPEAGTWPDGSCRSIVVPSGIAFAVVALTLERQLVGAKNQGGYDADVALCPSALSEGCLNEHENDSQDHHVRQFFLAQWDWPNFAGGQL